MFGTRALKAHHADVVRLYEARISELKAQIQDLRSMVLPTSGTPLSPLVAREADAILSGSQEQIEYDEETLADAEYAQAEADRLLTGNY